MSTKLNRAAALERRAAEALQTTRTARIGSRRVEADVGLIQLACGVLLQAECKYRQTLPKLLTDALDQARRYAPHAKPIAVLRERGKRAIVALDLDVFAHLVGLAVDALPTRHQPTRRNPKQLGLLDL